MLLALAVSYAVPVAAFQGDREKASQLDLRRAERLAVRRGRGMRSLFDRPIVQLRETGGRTVRLEAGAILAQERYLVPPLRKAIDADVTVGPPFRMRFRAGDLLLVRAGDPERSHCLLPDPLPRDADGVAYADVCLVDSDGDGRYERARFQPEDPDRRPLDLPIAPVALRTLPPSDQPGLLSVIAEQRLRVLRVGRDRATIQVESRLVPGGAANFPDIWSVSTGTREREVQLRLEEGGTARLAGLQLRATRDASGVWQAIVEGAFDDWLVLSEGNTVIDTGAVTLRPQ